MLRAQVPVVISCRDLRCSDGTVALGFLRLLRRMLALLLLLEGLGGARRGRVVDAAPGRDTVCIYERTFSMFNWCIKNQRKHCEPPVTGANNLRVISIWNCSRHGPLAHRSQKFPDIVIPVLCPAGTFTGYPSSSGSNGDMHQVSANRPLLLISEASHVLRLYFVVKMLSAVRILA